MTKKLKLLTIAVAAAVLSGCQTTPTPQDTETSTSSTSPISQNRTISQLTKMEPEAYVQVSMVNNNYESEELTQTIIDDYEKEKMLIEMSCEERISKINDERYGTYEGNVVSDREFMELRGQADQVIQDLESRMSDDSDEAMQLTYEVEIARLKLEFQVASLERQINETEVNRAFKLDVATRKAAAQYDCKVRHSENEYNKERMLQVIAGGDQINQEFIRELESLESDLEESHAELDMLNTEAFDGIIF